MESRERFHWSPRQVRDLFTRGAREWSEDNAPKQAAALAYYTLFALGPLLLIAVAVAGLVFGEAAARGAITSQLSGLLGPRTAEAVNGLMVGGINQNAGLFGLIAGSLALLFGAAGVFGQLRQSLDTVWEIKQRKVEGWRNKLNVRVRQDLLSFGAVMCIGFLLVVSLVASAGIAAITTYGHSLLPGSTLLWQGVDVVVNLLGLGLAFALMFKFLPDAKVAWRDVLFGAACTSILFVVGETLIGFYLGTAATATKYGAAGAIPVLLLWVYYSGLILFFGAQLTQVYANRYGTHVTPNARAESIQDAILKEQSRPEEEGMDGTRRARPRPGKATHARTAPPRIETRRE